MIVRPRLPLDRSNHWIGCEPGRFSRPMRIQFVTVYAVRTIRLLSRWMPWNDIVWRPLLVTELIGMSWGCLLTPYLLRCFMQSRIKLAGHTPGEPIQRWLIGLSALFVMGVVLAYMFEWQLGWAMVRLGNALSTVPVVQALKQYNMLTTPSGPDKGKGLVIAQVLLAYEQFYACLSLVAFTGETIQSMGTYSNGVMLLLRGMRKNSIMESNWIRASLHAIFICQLDEMSVSMQPDQSDADVVDNEERLPLSLVHRV